jgi:hypothetical protein
VSSHAAIEKRITRAKKVSAESKILFDVTAETDFAARLPAVQQALYLLFNEGYHGASPEAGIRSELCREAMRLAAMLLDHPFGATPATYALAVLMCLNAARLPARVDVSGNLHALIHQDRSLWDRELITEGLKLMGLSATGAEFTEFHAESAIAAVHATSARTADTDWGKIVSLYDTLMKIRPSPVVALNRAIAVAERDGPERGLDAVHAIEMPTGSRRVLSIQRRLASLSCAAEGARLPTGTPRRHWPWRVTRWSAPFWNSVRAPAAFDFFGELGSQGRSNSEKGPQLKGEAERIITATAPAVAAAACPATVTDRYPSAFGTNSTILPAACGPPDSRS